MIFIEYTYNQFCKIAHITIRTLRYYESIGLIKPIIKNNKRYLNEDYFLILQSIELLKKAGYTLQEIKQILLTKNIEEQIIMQQDLLNLQLSNTKAMLSLIEELKSNRNSNKTNIYKDFCRIQNKTNLQLQFDNIEGLQLRVLFHHQHTHFKDNFHQWMFKHYQFPENSKVLDIGCGDGTIWLNNQEKIPDNIKITLSDISLNMLKECQNKLSNIKQIKNIEEADCFYLPYPDKSFDVIIANHIFMYFDDLPKALKEVARVLKDEGILYCSTIAKDMMKERDLMLKDFDQRISFNQDILYQRFGYENGKEKLSHYFEDIQLYERKEVYEITDLDLYYRFILSGKGLSPNLEVLYKKKEQLYEFMKHYLKKNKVFHLTTHAGMFIAKKLPKI